MKEQPHFEIMFKEVTGSLGASAKVVGTIGKEIVKPLWQSETENQSAGALRVAAMTKVAKIKSPVIKSTLFVLFDL